MQSGNTSRNIQYIYDDKNRLVMVIEPPCTKTKYSYDDAGNTTLIETSNGKITIDSVQPPSASPFTFVRINGGIFNPQPSGNKVTFNGIIAKILSASTTQLVVEVPNVPIGPVTIKVESPPCDPATIDFTVIASQASLTIIPPTANVMVGSGVQFRAVVTGLLNKAVTWGLDSGPGSVDANGFYTAPSQFTQGNDKAVVRATTVEIGPSGSKLTATAMATILDRSPSSLIVTPASVVIETGQNQQFQAMVTGLTLNTVTWTTDFGMIGATTGLYTAPQTAGTATVTAISNGVIPGTTTKLTATATVIVQAAVVPTLTVMPSSVTLQPNTTQQFTAQVTGLSDTSVTWSVSGGGMIDSVTGLYTAPSSDPGNAIVVTATSNALPSLTGTATVSIGGIFTITNSGDKKFSKK
jgi:YD repeat-containing protein